MRNLRLYVLVIFATLFLGLQSFALAHTTANVSSNHSHDGVQCSVSAVSKSQTNIDDGPRATDIVRAEIDLTHTDYSGTCQHTDVPSPKGHSPPHI